MAIGYQIDTTTLNKTFGDEFNSFSASPDGSTGLWKTTYANGNRTLGSNGELEYYSDSSVGVNPFSIQNGVLDIRAAPGPNPLNLPYTSGAITTQSSFSQTYGYFEINAEMPAGKGLWPAFWLLPVDGSWPPELDILEVLGNDPTTLYFSTHSTVQATEGTTLHVADVSKGFHTYGTMWGPNTVDMYIDGIEVASMATPADMHKPMYMLANLAVGGYWPGNPDSSTPFPADMYINYIHAYAYTGTNGGVVNVTDPTANVGPVALAAVISMPGALTVLAGAATTVSGISVAANWPGGVFTATISDSRGQLKIGTVAGLSETSQSGTSITLTGGLAAINSALATLTYQANTTGTENIWISVTGPQGLKSTAGLLTTVATGPSPVVVTPPPVVVPLPAPPPVVVQPPAPTPPATTPVVTAPASLSLSAGSTQALAGVSITDNLAVGDISVTVSDNFGLLRTSAASGVTAVGEGTTSLRLTGSLAAVNSALVSLTYQAASTTGAEWLWVSGTDSTGAQALGHTVVTTTPAVVVTPPVVAPPVVAPPVVAPPVVFAPATATISAGTTQAVQGVRVTDGLTVGDISVTVSDNIGLLRTAATSGVTAVGEGTTSLRLTGSLAAVNSALVSLTYQASSTAGAEWLWVSGTDAAGAQALGHTVVTISPPVPVAPAVVVAPSMVFAPATATVSAGTTKAVSGVRISDGPTLGNISVTVSDNVGLLRTAPAIGVTAVGEGTTSLRLTGSLTAVNSALVSLTYQAASTVGAEWLWVSETDASGVQVLGHTVVTTTPAIVVAPAAAAAPPSVHTPVGVSMVVGTTMQLSGITLTGGQAGGDITVILSDSIGTLSTPPASGVVAQGVGSNALRLTGSIAAINADLVNLTYRAGASVGSDLLWVSATDASGAKSISPVVMNFVASPAASASAIVGLSGTTLAGPDTQTVVTAILTTKAGLLTTTNDFGVFATGEGTGTLILQGTKAAINADLVGLGYRPANGAALPGLADTLNIACYGGVGGSQPTLTLQLIGGHVTL